MRSRSVCTPTHTRSWEARHELAHRLPGRADRSLHPGPHARRRPLARAIRHTRRRGWPPGTAGRILRRRRGGLEPSGGGSATCRDWCLCCGCAGPSPVGTRRMDARSDPAPAGHGGWLVGGRAAARATPALPHGGSLARHGARRAVGVSACVGTRGWRDTSGPNGGCGPLLGRSRLVYRCGRRAWPGRDAGVRRASRCRAGRDERLPARRPDELEGSLWCRPNPLPVGLGFDPEGAGAGNGGDDQGTIAPLPGARHRARHGLGGEPAAGAGEWADLAQRAAHPDQGRQP